MSDDSDVELMDVECADVDLKSKSTEKVEMSQIDKSAEETSNSAYELPW